MRFMVTPIPLFFEEDGDNLKILTILLKRIIFNFALDLRVIFIFLNNLLTINIVLYLMVKLLLVIK